MHRCSLALRGLSWNGAGQNWRTNLYLFIYFSLSLRPASSDEHICRSCTSMRYQNWNEKTREIQPMACRYGTLSKHAHPQQQAPTFGRSCVCSAPKSWHLSRRVCILCIGIDAHLYCLWSCKTFQLAVSTHTHCTTSQWSPSVIHDQVGVSQLSAHHIAPYMACTSLLAPPWKVLCYTSSTCAARHSRCSVSVPPSRLEHCPCIVTLHSSHGRSVE